MDLQVTSAQEGWRIRVHNPGQRIIRYLNTKSYKTEAEALAEIDRVKDGFTSSKLGVQWIRVETTTGEVDWVHN